MTKIGDVENMVRPMKTWKVTLLACVIPGVVWADQPSIEAFIGSWKTAEISSSSDALAPNALDLKIAAEAGGFSLVWRDLGKSGQAGIGSEGIEAQFVPANRPGVYEYQPSSGSLFSSMFASPATGNPLEGETLIWARIDGDTLAVYSMMIDQAGGFDLDHYSWERTETGLQLTFTKKTEEKLSSEPIEGALVLGEG
jgi:hypothetical protein